MFSVVLVDHCPNIDTCTQKIIKMQHRFLAPLLCTRGLLCQSLCLLFTASNLTLCRSSQSGLNFCELSIFSLRPAEAEWFTVCVPHQVSISEADLQAMGGTITMVTQEGTTITIPAHELATQGAHSVTMVTADGSDEQVSSKQQLLMVNASGSDLI